MSQQQTFLNENGEPVNHYGLTQEEVERLEARADFFDALSDIQRSRCAEDDSASEGYTWRQMRQPSKREE